jgi:Na+/proline symporter
LVNVETERPKKAILKVSKSQRNIVDKDAEKSKYIRLGIWAVFLIVVGAIAAYFLPEHSVGSFFDLLKTIVTSLIL